MLTINAVALGLVIVFLAKEDVVTIALLGVLLIVQVIFFVRVLNRINRDLSSFFDSVYSLDSSISFKESLVSKQFAGLYEKMIKVNSMIGSLRINLEEQNEYYKRITNQMPISIISYYDDGKIGLINAAGKKLFGLENIRHIKELEEVSKELTEYLVENEETNQQVIKTAINKETVSLIIKISSTTILKKRIRIASLQNIESELGQKEIESWQRLLKVLTHEIANSIAPISSTIETLNELSLEDQDQGYQAKIKTGLGIIGERSEGLLQLLKDIRRFSSFPPPKMTELNVMELFSSVSELLREELAREGIDLVLEAGSDQFVLADKQLLTHVLINLLTNAKEALTENKEKKISLRSDTDGQGFVYLRVIDNGPGISKEKLDQILIPFFTTKDSGSGIGLSISREIMRQHGGTILVSSISGKTEFALKFCGGGF